MLLFPNELLSNVQPGINQCTVSLDNSSTSSAIRIESERPRAAYFATTPTAGCHRYPRLRSLGPVLFIRVDAGVFIAARAATLKTRGLSVELEHNSKTTSLCCVNRCMDAKMSWILCSVMLLLCCPCFSSCKRRVSFDVTGLSRSIPLVSNSQPTDRPYCV
jgi:hypothetical protein